jgi:hypothetical protein
MLWKALFSLKVTDRGGTGLFILMRSISNSISAAIVLATFSSSQRAEESLTEEMTSAEWKEKEAP